MANTGMSGTKPHVIKDVLVGRTQCGVKLHGEHSAYTQPPPDQRNSNLLKNSHTSYGGCNDESSDKRQNENTSSNDPIIDISVTPNDSSSKELFEGLAEDIFAFAVRTILQGITGVRLAHVLLGMVFTAVLQLGLLIVLWYVVTTPPEGNQNEKERPQGQSSPGIDVSSLLVNVLAFFALVVFVHDEVRRASALCHVAAKAAGILPVFYAPDDWGARAKPVVHWSLQLVALFAPVLQLSVALLVLLSASLLAFTRENQVSNVQVIVNSVALGFILEIDNTIGLMVARQHAKSSEANGLLSIMTAAIIHTGSGPVPAMFILASLGCFLQWSQYSSLHNSVWPLQR
jgi:hypothetical protein